MSPRIKDSLRAARIETAINICILHPTLYAKFESRQPHFSNDKERLCAQVLSSLMKQEPCIKHILSFYYKREER